VISIAAGAQHSVAINTDHKVLLWGANRLCQLSYSARVKEIYRPVLFSGQLDAISTRQFIAHDKITEDVMFDNLKYIRVECSSSITVAQINQFPFLLIWGNGNQTAWSKPDILQKQPKMFRCVGIYVYVLTFEGLFYKIDSAKRIYTKIEEDADDAMDGEVL
jgi:hypothetical protein